MTTLLFPWLPNSTINLAQFIFLGTWPLATFWHPCILNSMVFESKSNLISIISPFGSCWICLLPRDKPNAHDGYYCSKLGNHPLSEVYKAAAKFDRKQYTNKFNCNMWVRQVTNELGYNIRKNWNCGCVLPRNIRKCVWHFVCEFW